MARTSKVKLPAVTLSKAVATVLEKSKNPQCTVIGKFIQVLGYRNEQAERGPFHKGSFVKIEDIYPNVCSENSKKTSKDFFCDASGFDAAGEVQYYQFFLDELDIDSITDNPPEESTMTATKKTKKEVIVDTALTGEVQAASITDRYLSRPDIEESIKELMTAEGANKVALAALCTQIYENPSFYKDKGYGTFIDYANEVLGMERRKAYHMVQVYTACRNAGITNATLERLGYSKLLPIIQAYKDEYGRIVDMVNLAIEYDMSYNEIKGRIIQLAEQGAGRTEAITDGVMESTAQVIARSKHFEFTLYDNRADEMEEIIRRTAESLERQDLPHAMGDVFYHITQQYLLSQENVDRTLDFDMELIFARHGVRVVPAQPEGTMPAEDHLTA